MYLGQSKPHRDELRDKEAMAYGAGVQAISKDKNSMDHGRGGRVWQAQVLGETIFVEEGTDDDDGRVIPLLECFHQKFQLDDDDGGEFERLLLFLHLNW